MRQDTENHVAVQDRALELQQLGFVTSGVVHDFNNLLSTILSEAGMALYKLPAGDVAREHVERVEKAAKHASRLTSSLMAYVNGSDLYFESISLNLLVTDMVGLLRATFPYTAFQLNLATHLPGFRAREGHIQQVVMNLLINAAQAAQSRNGIVNVRTGDAVIATVELVGSSGRLTPGKYVFLQVVDNGPGIKEDVLAHIFDPFFSSRHRGQGLGLATVANILSNYGGGIVVENQVDMGASFTAYMPYDTQPMG